MTRGRFLAELFQAETPTLRRFLRRFGPSVSADDIAQESFLHLCAVDPNKVQSPRAYLFQTARNLALNALRHDRCLPISTVADPDALDAGSSAASPEEALLRTEAEARANAALAALPRHLREALLLHRLEELSHDEVAARLGVSRSTVKRFIADALARCAVMMNSEGPPPLPPKSGTRS